MNHRSARKCFVEPDVHSIKFTRDNDGMLTMSEETLGKLMFTFAHWWQRGQYKLNYSDPDECRVVAMFITRAIDKIQAGEWTLDTRAGNPPPHISPSNSQSGGIQDGEWIGDDILRKLYGDERVIAASNGRWPAEDYFAPRLEDGSLDWTLAAITAFYAAKEARDAVE